MNGRFRLPKNTGRIASVAGLVGAFGFWMYNESKDEDKKHYPIKYLKFRLGYPGDKFEDWMIYSIKKYDPTSHIPQGVLIPEYMPVILYHVICESDKYKNNTRVETMVKRWLHKNDERFVNILKTTSAATFKINIMNFYFDWIHIKNYEQTAKIIMKLHPENYFCLPKYIIRRKTIIDEYLSLYDAETIIKQMKRMKLLYNFMCDDEFVLEFAKKYPDEMDTFNDHPIYYTIKNIHEDGSPKLSVTNEEIKNLFDAM